MGKTGLVQWNDDDGTRVVILTVTARDLREMDRDLCEMLSEAERLIARALRLPPPQTEAGSYEAPFLRARRVGS